MANETAIRQELEDLAARLDLKSYLLLYLDGDKVRTTGSLTVSSLMPLLLEAMSKRASK